MLRALPNLSPSGLAAVKSSVEALLLPTGLASRLATQEALAARSGGAPPRLRTNANAKGKGKSDSKGPSGSAKDSKDSVSKWKSLDPARRKILDQNELLIEESVKSAKLWSALSTEEKRALKGATSEEDWKSYAGTNTSLLERGSEMALRRAKLYALREALATELPDNAIPTKDELQKIMDQTSKGFWKTPTRQRRRKGGGAMEVEVPEKEDLEFSADPPLSPAGAVGSPKKVSKVGDSMGVFFDGQASQRRSGPAPICFHDGRQSHTCLNAV